MRHLAVKSSVQNEQIHIAGWPCFGVLGVAAAVALGTDGVWVGTRFLATTKANVHPEQHHRLLDARGEDTAVIGIRSEMLSFNPMRLLAVDVVRQYNDRVAELPTEGRAYLRVIGETTLLGQPHVKHQFAVSLPTPETTGDFEEMAWLSGQGVGLIREILPARVVVSELMEGAVALIRQSAGTVVS